MCPTVGSCTRRVPHSCDSGDHCSLEESRIELHTRCRISRCSIPVAPGLRIPPYFAAFCRAKWLMFFRCNVFRRTLNQRVGGSSPPRFTTCFQEDVRVLVD